MASVLEFEEKNVELAVDKACKELNVQKEALDYDVLSYGSTGIFGLVGSKKAKILVKLAEENARAIEEKDVENHPSETADEKKPFFTEKDAVEDMETSIPEEAVAVCRKALQRIIDTITTDATIIEERDASQILFDIKGGNAAVLIGKRGQTLEAIQYIIEKIANKGNNQRIRVQVDVEGYLKTRRTNLEKLAARLAEKAVRTGKPMTIGQMNAHDRRIVHLALKNENGVRTQSLGNGAYRKLMIYPRKRGSGRRMST
jgi:spoIIIJ-associated protein